MQNEIILNGISFDQLQDSIKTIVQNEVQKIVSGLPTATEPAPELITRKETALILGISLPTLSVWTSTGIIPAQRIGTRIKILKTFMSEANNRGINVPTDYTKKSFKKPNEESFSIYLTESELMQMYYIETSPESLEILRKEFITNKFPDYLAKVRDLFLIGCYTGLRFSDLSKLNKDNINKDNTINIKTIKTNQSVVVPIHPITKQIFEKYNYQLPREISNQKFNEYLKDVAKIAGINEPITAESTKGGFKVSETTEKYNLVTSHTARRSFATNAFLMDMPSISIMKITGHKTESAFMRYIKMSAKDNAIKMQSHKFFNPMLIAK